MKIKEGHFYRDGHGEKRGPMKEEHYWFTDDRGWGFYPNGQRMARCVSPHPDHLVSEWVEPDSESLVRTVTRREIVPGVYGRVSVTGTYQGNRVILDWSGNDSIHTAVAVVGLSAQELRSAAMVLSQLAEALDDA